MSCERSTTAFLTIAGSQCAAVLGVSPGEATAALGEILELATTRAAQRPPLPPSTDQTVGARQVRLKALADDAAATEATATIFREIRDVHHLAPPAHTDPHSQYGVPLPRRETRFGWQAIAATRDALLNNLPLPPLAQEVIDALKRRAGLPELLPGAPAPSGVTAFVGHPHFTGPGTPAAAYFGSPAAAEDALGRIYTATLREAQAVWRRGGYIGGKAYLGYADIQQLEWTLRSLQIDHPLLHTDINHLPHDEQLAYAAVGRVLASLRAHADKPRKRIGEREGDIVRASIPRRSIADVDQELQTALTQSRGTTDALPLAQHLLPGPDRDDLLREVAQQIIAMNPSRQRELVLAQFIVATPSQAVLDDAIGMAIALTRTRGTADAIEMLVPQLAESGLQRWEQRAAALRNDRVRDALLGAIASARKVRADAAARGESLHCHDCGAYLGATAHAIRTAHQCPGPTPARLRARGIAEQAHAMLATTSDTAARQAIVAEARARLLRISSLHAPTDQITWCIVDDLTALSQAASDSYP